ncbi:MAG: glutamine amidotransferase [Lentisphaerae bacterium]|nr:glutamine amidotransferase [Lentisphaerota bacterium]
MTWGDTGRRGRRQRARTAGGRRLSLAHTPAPVAGWTLAAALALLSALPAPAPAAPSPLGLNLLPEGDFERWSQAAPDGWTLSTNTGSCAADTTACATGRASARLHLPPGQGAVRLVSRATPASAGFYFARVMLRVDGMSRRGDFEGGSLGLTLEWRDAQDALLQRKAVAWTYGPTDWAYRDQILEAPAGTASARAVVELSGDSRMPLAATGWIDDVALCPYTPPRGIGDRAVGEFSIVAGQPVLRTVDAIGWGYPAGILVGPDTDTVQGEWTRDALATFGAALHTRPGVPAGDVFHSGYVTDQPPGLYRVILRARLPPHPAWDTNAPVLLTHAVHVASGAHGGRTISAADFHTPGAYEEFSYDVVKPSAGWVSFGVRTPGGNVESWLDYLRVVQLVRFRDTDLPHWYPGVTGRATETVPLPATGAQRALLVEGLLANVYRCGELLAHAGWTTDVARIKIFNGVIQLPGFPVGAPELRAHRLVILANATLDALAPEQRYQLRRFVEDGGGLLVLGGKTAYGNGGLRGSFLEDVVPVVTADSAFDIEAQSAPLTAGPDAPALALALPRGLAAPFVHRATVKPGSLLLATAGDRPYLVGGTFGRGRVACLLGTPYGRAPTGQRLITEWSGYPPFFHAVVAWLTGGDKR